MADMTHPAMQAQTPVPRGWATAVMVTALLLSLAWPISQGAQIGLLLGGIALVGAPHGVFDIDLLRRAGEGGRGQVARLTLLYLACIAVVLLGWRVAPVLTLVAFLALAVAHFGFEDGEVDDSRSVEAALHVFARGTCVVAPLLLARSGAIVQILSELTGDAPSSVVATLDVAAAPLLGVWLVSAGASVGLHLRAGRRWAAAELGALALLFLVAPPLLAFAVYFAGVHSVRHVLHACRLRGLREGRPALAWSLAWLAPAAAMSVAVVLAMAAHAEAAVAMAQALRLLAALAAPHLLLGPWLERRARAQSSSASPSPPPLCISDLTGA